MRTHAQIGPLDSATGLALASRPVAVERGSMLCPAAVEQALPTLRFFWNSPQGPEPYTIPMGDSSKMQVGDLVFAIGDPFGVGQTATMGIVSATGRANLGIEDYEDFIQTDAPINPGNSGGALINAEGN